MYKLQQLEKSVVKFPTRMYKYKNCGEIPHVYVQVHGHGLVTGSLISIRTDVSIIAKRMNKLCCSSKGMTICNNILQTQTH